MMAVSMSASGKMNSSMAKVLKLGLMGVSILEISRRAKWTDSEGTPGPMDSIMKAKWPRVIFMGKVTDFSLMEGFTTVAGRKMSCMA